MANDKIDELIAVDKWVFETLRYTSFIVDFNEPAGLQEWWKNTTKLPNQEYTRKINGYTEKGLIENNELLMQWQPGRIDWLINSPSNNPESNSPINNIFNIGSIESAIAEYKTLINNWLKLPECPLSKRIALGGIALLQVNDRETGYVLLNKLLNNNVTLDVHNVSDFIYQINRIRPSTSTPELSINRLVKWMVAQLTLFNIRIGIDNSKMINSNNGLYYVRVEFDLNTNNTYNGKLDGEKQSILLNELIDVLRDVIYNGDK